MKHIKAYGKFTDVHYQLFEADTPSQPGKFSWAKDLTIPHDIQMDIHDMSYELRDEGYTVSYQWWPPYEQSNKSYKDNKYPSINITKRDPNNEFAWEKISYAWIKDFCERVSSYLDDKDYNTVVKFRKVNTNDYYDINKSYPNQEPFSDHHMATSIHFRIEMISRDVYGDVNESVESTEQDLKDILLELKDMGYRIIYEDDVKLRGSPGEPGNVKAIIVRDVMRPSDWIELPWSELKEYALRIKDYLGDKYLSFMWRKVISDNPGTLGDNPYKTIELNEETEINDRVWSFVIKYKE
jgi:hypothetical protein